MEIQVTEGACPDVRRAFCDRDWGVIGCPDYSA